MLNVRSSPLSVPMLKTLDISKEVLGNVVLIRVVEDARTAVQEGESLAVALKRPNKKFR